MGNSIFAIDSIPSVHTTINSVVFMPPKTPKLDIVNLQYNNCKLLYLTSKNNINISTIEILYHHQKRNYDKLIIFSHGNAEDLYNCCDFLHALSRDMKVDVICYDYPGYGISTGNPSEKGCYEALETVINNYKKKYSHIILIGRSLGTGITINYLSKNTNWNDPVILVSSYKSIPRVACDLPIEGLLYDNKFGSIYKIDKINCPIKFIHGKKDELIHFRHSEDLYDKLKNKKFKPCYVEDADHNNVFMYLQPLEIKEVIDSV